MTAATLDFRPAPAPGVAAREAANVVFLFARAAPPVSRRPLLCRWHCDSGGRLVCAWTRDIVSDPVAGGGPNPPEIA